MQKAKRRITLRSENCSKPTMAEMTAMKYTKWMRSFRPNWTAMLPMPTGPVIMLGETVRMTRLRRLM